MSDDSTTRTAEPIAPTAFGTVAPLRGGAMLGGGVLGDGVLGRWQRRNRDRTIPYGIEQVAASGALDNLRRVTGESDAPFRGPVFADSDVYKALEAVAWELGHRGDPRMRAFFDETVGLLERAQDPDGYLNSAYQRADPDRTVRADFASVRARWTDFAFGHELYCAGHLMQAAVAAARSMGDERLLGVALRLADLIVARFGGAESPVYPGHPEVEYALVELYRLTGRRDYLEVAAAFIDRRGVGFLGAGVFGSDYYQDETPVRDATEMRGHAVRALYLNAGATDVYLETGDETLLRALRAQWDDLVSRRSYLTGGTGSRHHGEAFGDAFELPSDRAYAETCAGIAAMHWAWRMYLATGEATHLDFFETALYNVVAAGVGDSGERFFYSNPLQVRADHVTVQEEAAGSRLRWYFCACCPPNLMRTFASIEGYLGGVRGSELQVANFTRSRLVADIDGMRVVVDVDTDYPADGRVRLTVVEGFTGSETATDAPSLALRIPAWSRGVKIAVNGSAVPAEARDGWLHLPGALALGTVVELGFDMTPQVLAPDVRIDGIRGSVAVRRGPVVYCAEQRDNDADLDLVALDPMSALVTTDETTELGPVLTVPGSVRVAGEPYAPWSAERPATTPTQLRLRPYATWANGDPGAMRVWIPTP